MRFRLSTAGAVVSLWLLAVAMTVTPSPASAACSECPNCVLAPLMAGTKTWTWTSGSCATGYPVIESMYISASTAMPFTVSTFDPADTSTVYSGGTTTTSTTCFEASSTTTSVIGGSKHVSVEVSCNAPTTNVLCVLYFGVTTKCEVAAICADVDCGDNGACDSTTGTCTCDTGYYGSTCSLTSDPNSASTRSSDRLMTAMLAGAALAMAAL